VIFEILNIRENTGNSTEKCNNILMSLLSHQKNPQLNQKQKILYHFGVKNLGIHLHVTSRHPQQLICHLLNSKLDQDESLINILRSRSVPIFIQCSEERKNEKCRSRSVFCPWCLHPQIKYETDIFFKKNS
jgi:hypothetical protein